jgi:catechol 2,3-dioxygenase-like lactoylglutathione lyase family enzyme
MTDKDIYIHHFSVVAPAAIIEETMRFYRDALGIVPGFRPEFNLPGYWLYSGSNPLIHLTAKEDRDQNGSRFFHHFALRCTNYSEVIERLASMNIEYRKLNANDVNETQVTVIDPAGNLVELNFEKR